MRRVFSVLGVCGLLAGAAHAELLKWDPRSGARLGAKVEADGRTRLSFYPYEAMARATSVRGGVRLSLVPMTGNAPNVRVVMPIVRLDEGRFASGEAATTVALEDGSYRAALTVVDSEGREVSEVYEQTIVARDCGFSGQGGSTEEEDQVGPPGPRWRREPTVESLHLGKTGGVSLHARMEVSAADVQFRMRVLRPDGSELFHCVEPKNPYEDRVMTGIGGALDWPDYVLVDFSLVNEAGQLVETRRQLVDVVRSVDDPECIASIDDFSWSEKIVTFVVLPLLLGLVAGSMLGRLRRRDRAARRRFLM